jgi:signal transduction histidine kinase
MNMFLSQVFNILTSETGSLTYHLVLAFSIAAALQIALIHSRARSETYARRAALGLGLLLLFRLTLFAASGLAWQGLLDPAVLLPPLDRAVTVISLLVIAWMWAFPAPRRMVDTAALLLGLLTLTLIALGLVWWSEQGQGQPFVGSMLEFSAETLAWVFLGLGALVLLLRRPSGWGVGLAMLTLLALGHAAHQLLPPTDRDYSGAIRLAQLAGYPLLLALSQRVLMAVPVPELAAAGADAKISAPDKKIGPIFLDLLSETDSSKICPSLSASIAYLMRADLCLLVSLYEGQNTMNIECAYNLISEAHLAGGVVDVRHTPFLVNALRRSKPVRMPASSTSPDQFGLARALDLPDGGNMLAAPLPMSDPDPVLAVVLLSPYSQRSWSTEDQDELQDVLAIMAQFLQRNMKLNALQVENELMGQKLEAAAQEAAQAGQEKDGILDQLARVRQTSEVELSNLERQEALSAEQEEVRLTLQQLRAENEYLRAMLTEWDDAHLKDVRAESMFTSGELRMALEEIASLRAALAEAEQRLAQPAAPSAMEGPEREAIMNLAHELRQPMSSLLGYTNVLLKEIDDPQPEQRKLIDRIRVAVERMNRIIDDLIQTSAAEDEHSLQAGERVDLNAVIDQVIAQAGEQLRQKQIALRVDLPDSLPPLTADRTVLQRVLLGLVRNAGEATPLMGEILLRGRVEGMEGEQRYILLQVADAGEGISSGDLAHIFSPIYRTENPVISGLGETSGDLAETKNLVENLGGRIWVDSRPGQGSTFSLVLPVSMNHNGALGR